MGDSHGNVIYLNERRCSIQRRHRRVIKKSAFALPFTDAARKAMGDSCAAVKAKSSTGNAGTVEFVVSKTRTAIR
jgi:propionyl-CoA carboxylase alpha chain